jgi:hypothetical protein
MISLGGQRVPIWRCQLLFGPCKIAAMSILRVKWGCPAVEASFQYSNQSLLRVAPSTHFGLMAAR